MASPVPTPDETAADRRDGSAAAATFVAGGEMGERMRALDWSRTPLGPPEGWPQGLRSTVGICLSSGFPIALYWGPDLALIREER